MVKPIFRNDTQKCWKNISKYQNLLKKFETFDIKDIYDQEVEVKDRREPWNFYNYFKNKIITINKGDKRQHFLKSRFQKEPREDTGLQLFGYTVK